jgi:hypothetical protein
MTAVSNHIGLGGERRMLKRLASWIFLLDSLVIGLGAFGHGLQVRHLHVALDRFPIEPDMHSMIYVVWYFVSGCMLTFGVTLVWIWWRLRSGHGRILFAATFIGALYVGIGVFGLIYRAGDPFMAVFVCLGAVLLLSAYVLSEQTARIARSSGLMTKNFFEGALNGSALEAGP